MEVDFIEKEVQAGRMTKWRVIAPQLKAGFTKKLSGFGNREFSVIERARVSETRFGVFSEPRHRAVASYIAGVEDLDKPGRELERLRTAELPVLVLYLVRERGVADSDTSLGFGIQYPGKKRDVAISWTVRDASQADAVVVTAKPKSK